MSLIPARYQKRFADTGESFSALHSCQSWLVDHGFSHGPLQEGVPIGVMFGDYKIGKWKTLDAEEKNDLHGQIIASSGSYRSGQVVVAIRSNAPAEVIEAFLKACDAEAQAHVEGAQA